MNRSLRLAVGLGAAAMVTISGAGMAADQFKFDLGSAYPDQALISLGAKDFIRLVGEKTKGTVQITGQFGGSLGYKSRELYEAAEEGAVDLATFPLDNLLGLDPLFELHSLPFVSPSFKASKAMFDAARSEHEKAFNRVNQTVLFATVWTPWGVWAKKPIKVIGDFDGLKLRTVDVIATNVFKSVGVHAIQLAWADVIPALGTGTIDGLVTSDETGANARVWEHGVKYFSLLNYTIGIAPITMNLDAYNKLSADQKKAVREAAAEAEPIAWARAAERVAHNKKILEDNGGTFLDAPPAVIDALKKIGQPYVDEWKNKMGKVGEEIFARYEQSMKK